MVWVCGLSSLGHDRMQWGILVNIAMNLRCIKAERSLPRRAPLPETRQHCVHDDVSASQVIMHRTQSAYDHKDGWARFGSTRLWRSRDSREPERDSNSVLSLYKSRPLPILAARRCTVWGKEQEVRTHLKKRASFCRIWGYHNRGYEESYLLGYNAG
jgi:hypothetical protein